MNNIQKDFRAIWKECIIQLILQLVCLIQQKRQVESKYAVFGRAIHENNLQTFTNLIWEI